MKFYTGGGLVNNLINSLPFELHIPGYNYCGPGTRLSKRLMSGSKPINKLDEACMEHDIKYSKEKDLKHRHKADEILATKAMERYHSSDASLTEKMAALGVSGIMRSKVKLGMGIGNKRQQRNVLRKLLKNLLLIRKKCNEIILSVEEENSGEKAIKLLKPRILKSKPTQPSQQQQNQIPTPAMIKIMTSNRTAAADAAPAVADTINKKKNRKPILRVKKRKSVYSNDEIESKRLKINTDNDKIDYEEIPYIKRKRTTDEDQDENGGAKRTRILPINM